MESKGRQCTRGDTCSFRGKSTRSSSLAPEPQTTSDGKHFLKGKGLRGPSSSGKRFRTPYKDNISGTCTNPRVILGILPCVKITRSTVVASCHHSLSAWHQSVLAHVSCPLPDFPARASTLDSPFSSLTQILFDSASLRSRRRPTVSRPRTRQPLWWIDACYRALVARHGSWRDFRRSGHKRIRLVSASCASSFTAQFVPPGPTSGTSGLVL